MRELKHSAHGESWDVAAEVGGRQVEFSLTPGAPHRVQNALAALAAVHAAGLDETALANQLAQVGIMSGRGVEQTAGGATLIDDIDLGALRELTISLEQTLELVVRTDLRKRLTVGQEVSVDMAENDVSVWPE